MTPAQKLVAVFVGCAMPVAAFAAAVGNSGAVINNYPGTYTPPNLVAPNAVPGGITLVPGTVVTPAVGGTVVTGTVPLAGTVGSTGVGTFDPGLGRNPNNPVASGTLYPQAVYPQTGLPGTNQTTLPQTIPGVPSAASAGSMGLQNVIPYGGAAPSIGNCPRGATSGNGTC